MKKFLRQITFFLSPIIFSFLLTELLFSTDKGDLLKVGYIADINTYDKHKIFKEEFHKKKHFTNISELDLNNKHDFKTLVIGDSFSEQGNFGFTNYLAELNSDSLLYLDRDLHDNPFQTIYGILNGDLLDSINLKYIVLQSVEREIVFRTDFNESATLTIDSLRKIMERRKSQIGTGSNQVDKLFSDRFLKFMTINLGYKFDDNGFYSDTYIVKTKDTLFSEKNNNLLFYYIDLQSIEENSNSKKLERLNIQFNDLSSKLSEKGIKLIVLISPDKFGVYYDQIIQKEKYPKPQFFEIFNKLSKNYLFVNSEEILKNAISEETDIYFYDDTHWSPKASKIIANEINSLMNRDE